MKLINGEQLIEVETGPGPRMPRCSLPVGEACDVWLRGRGLEEPSIADKIHALWLRGTRTRDAATGRFT